MGLRTFPPDYGGAGGRATVVSLLRWLVTLPTSNGLPAKKTGPFSSAFSSAFYRTDP